jgi:hypothetical protein
MSMILLEPAYKITQSKPGDQAADHLSNAVSREKWNSKVTLALVWPK